MEDLNSHESSYGGDVAGAVRIQPHEGGRKAWYCRGIPSLNFRGFPIDIPIDVIGALSL